MIIKFDVESDLYRQIENLVKEGKYQDIIQFIKIATVNQLEEEKSGTLPSEVDDGFSISGTIKPKSDVFIDFDSRKTTLTNLQFEKSEIERKDKDFIWSFYNRFFPVKIAIFSLAALVTPEKPWYDLEEWKENAAIAAQGWYKVLREFELENDVKMHQRITIGLPTHNFELTRVKKKSEKIKLQKKIESSKNRFVNQFVGRFNKKNETMEGACFSMNLISVKFSGNRCLISLTKLGKKFALLENPLFKKDFTKVFSNDEVKLIYNEMISKFITEQQIIKDVIQDLKQKTLTSDQIQDIFTGYKKLIFEYTSDKPEELDEKQKKDKIIQARVATMGRLSELKIVDWEVINSISHYSINKEKRTLLDI